MYLASLEAFAILSSGKRSYMLLIKEETGQKRSEKKVHLVPMHLEFDFTFLN